MAELKSNSITKEQIAHDLSLVRLNKKLDSAQSSSIGDVYKMYLEGVEMFEKLINDVEKGEIKL